MTYYVQETDSRIVYPLPPELRYSVAGRLVNETFGSTPQANYLSLRLGLDLIGSPYELIYQVENEEIAQESERPVSVIQETASTLNETFGGSLHASYLPLRARSELIRPAWELIHQVENKEIAQEAKRLLSVIQETVSTFQLLQFDVGYIPQLQAFTVDDGSVLFEWAFNDYRIGFSIEPNPQDSGWFLITNRKLGEISAFGFISGIELHPLILWLLNFILSHS
ncbi:MAG TPA: hypothetical protein EYP19_09700 [Desulfobacterales bacterium]|nr:hypothetical protein [Desulfobacterales bacterium]